MTTITELCAVATDKSRFVSIQNYIDFSKWFLEFISDSNNYEARIISRKENNYKFYQYKSEASYNVTRPVNGDLFLSEAKADFAFAFFRDVLRDTERLRGLNNEEGALLNAVIYTLQQSIGCALDALPASKNNVAKKINGDLFERLMLYIFQEMGFYVMGLVENLQIEDFQMKYQHDLFFQKEGALKAIGSVKTSGKDRLDKVFLDKLFYNKLKRVDVPHFAIFLGDVQRSGRESDYGVSQTFLPGHFKAYTLAMNPLDGVYYCDLRPIMKTDRLLKQEIKRLDELLCRDIWSLMGMDEYGGNKQEVYGNI